MIVTHASGQSLKHGIVFFFQLLQISQIVMPSESQFCEALETGDGVRKGLNLREVLQEEALEHWQGAPMESWRAIIEYMFLRNKDPAVLRVSPTRTAAPSLHHNHKGQADEVAAAE